IRDFHVTGVQTCALPIYAGGLGIFLDREESLTAGVLDLALIPGHHCAIATDETDGDNLHIREIVLPFCGLERAVEDQALRHIMEIGRASCRGIVSLSVDC